MLSLSPVMIACKFVHVVVKCNIIHLKINKIKTQIDLKQAFMCA